MFQPLLEEESHKFAEGNTIFFLTPLLLLLLHNSIPPFFLLLKEIEAHRS